MVLRRAERADVPALLEIETSCFQSDRLSRRSFQRWIASPHGILLLAETEQDVLGYGLVWCLKGTLLARMYSLAVHPDARGMGLAGRLMVELEAQAAARGRCYMRLEVAESNLAAQTLYRQRGYHSFGAYHDYYDDHSDALRMQKRLHAPADRRVYRAAPWYRQSTEFTCGPAALLMAAGSFDAERPLSQEEELDIWREATTIFMTSGHGGCHPIGLALAATRRGMRAEVFLSTREALFVSGVRAEHKKQVMTLVHDSFVRQAQAQALPLHYEELKLDTLESLFSQGKALLMLISTYRLDGHKAPHWVLVTGFDAQCVYVHDPEQGERQQPLDCQDLPIARDSMVKMLSYGSKRLRAVIVLERD